MPTPRSILPLASLAAVGLVAACSSGDPYDLRPGASAPAGTGWIDPIDAAPSSTWRDAAAWDSAPWEASTGWDAESGWTADAGTDAWPIDSGSPTQGSGGTCGNPLCFTDGLGDCGCYATDSQGDTVTLGCSGGACGCFVNQTQTDDDVVSAGACDSSSTVVQAFLTGCSCE